MQRYYNNEITKEELTAWINAMAYISNLKIYILNPDASVLHKVSESEEMSMNIQIKQDILKVMEGETVSRMNAVSLNQESNLVYVGIPLTYNDTVSGVIMAFSPITEMEVLISAIILFIIGMGLIYFFSDEYLDKQEEKMIERIVNERSENSNESKSNSKF